MLARFVGEVTKDSQAEIRGLCEPAPGWVLLFGLAPEEPCVIVPT
jgi:hypothetical protein